MSDSKECEHSEQLYPIKPNNGIKSNNPPNNAKFSAKAQIPKYNNHLHKNHLLFAQNKPTNDCTLNKKNKLINSNNSVNHISKMSKVKAPRSKSTPTKARVTFSDTTPSTPGTNTSSNNKTPTGSMIEETDDILFTETLNKVFSRKFLAILTGKDAILKEVRDCVIRDDPDKSLSLFLLAGFGRKTWLCVFGRADSHSKINQRCSTAGYPLNASREFCHAISRAKHLVAVHPPRYTGKSQCVQSLHGDW